MNILLSDVFQTKLGIIQTRVESINHNLFTANSNLITTANYRINLQAFELKTDWMIRKCESSIVWRWYVEKISDDDEQLTIYCELIEPQSDILCDPDSGEHLDAVEIENSTHHLHIGTEDGEIMNYRAGINDWIPKRYKNKLGFESTCYSFTEYINFGFKTTIPQLFKGEKIYFQFLVATNPIKPSQNYPNERDISTWLAVDVSKNNLDQYFKNIVN